MPNEKRSVFDLNKMQVFPFSERDKNVFFSGAGFKTRIIALPSGGIMPECPMSTAVIFYVVSGEVEITVEGKVNHLSAGFCLFGEPGRYSMQTATGVRLMGVQIETGISELQR